jgi:hypothetical protein
MYYMTKLLAARYGRLALIVVWQKDGDQSQKHSKVSERLKEGDSSEDFTFLLQTQLGLANSTVTHI